VKSQAMPLKNEPTIGPEQWACQTPLPANRIPDLDCKSLSQTKLHAEQSRGFLERPMAFLSQMFTEIIRGNDPGTICGRKILKMR
jgi:hypothetical protein